jgi:hypothetical protein
MIIPDWIMILLLQIPLFTLLFYPIVVSYLDIVYREVDHYVWIPLVLLNIPTMAAVILTGGGLFYVPGIVATIVFYIAMRLGAFEGADFIYLSLISLIFIYNPLSNHYFMTFSFMIYLTACLLSTAFFILAYNMTHGKGLTLDVDRGVPLMVPISAALLLTVYLA